MQNHSRFIDALVRLLFLLSVLLSLQVSAPVSAADANATTLPDRVQRQGGGPELVLNGSGVRVIALFKVYIAGLYLPATNHDGEAILRAHAPSQLHIHLLRNLTVDELKNGITGTLRATLTPEQVLPLESRMQQLDGIFTSLQLLKKGSTFIIGYQPNVGTTIQVDGENKGLIPGADFNEAILRIWIGDRPRDPHLRKTLLGISGAESSTSAITATVRN